MIIKRVFNIIGETERTRDYEPAAFIVMNDGMIYSYNKSCGLIPREEITKARLKTHLYKMVIEGFTVKPETDKEVIRRYAKRIATMNDCMVICG